jgi:Outer membrane protein beta-barrel domain
MIVRMKSRPVGWIIAVVLLVTICSQAQTTYRRIELGAQTSMMLTDDGFGTGSRWGIGPAVTLNLTQHFAIDGSATFFPGYSSSATNRSGGRLTQALGGVKASIRGKSVTLFAKARPGFLSWSHVVTDCTLPQGWPGPSTCYYSRRNSFVIDLGGGVQYSLSPRIGIRLEAGDTLIGSPFGFYTNNLQISTAVAYRFGKEISVEQAPSHPEMHRFFDRTNVAIMTASVLAQTADAITTQRFMGNCWKRNPTPNACTDLEGNPIARPFVNHGWAGQIGLMTMVTSVQALTQFAIHRMGHHKVERFVPVPLTIGSSIAAYKNLNSSQMYHGGEIVAPVVVTME